MTVDRVELALANDKLISKLSEQSINHHRMTIKQFSRWAWTTKGATEHPLALWHLPTVRTQPRRRDRFHAQELELVIAAALASTRPTEYTGEQRAWLYRLAAVTGLRRGELAALKPSSFDMAQKAVRVAPAYTKNGKAAELPLPTKLVPELSRWLSEHEAERPLFPGLRQRRVSDMLHADMKEAGVPIKTPEGRRSFHSLRNTFISNLWDAGLPGVVVQRLARHSIMDLTVKYARLAPGAEAAAVELLPSLLDSRDN